MGGTVVAVSDSSGGVYNEDGFDAVAAKDHKRETGSVVGFEGGDEEITNDELLQLDVDLLIPAALEKRHHRGDCPGRPGGRHLRSGQRTDHAEWRRRPWPRKT